MAIELSKRKKYLLLLLVVLMLSGAAAGIYLFVNPSTRNDDTYQTDKYSESIGWCELNQNEESLTSKCKGLLLGIRGEGENSCFDLQVITNTKELKNLTVCEKGELLTYGNEILEYKKLMPIMTTFTYSKDESFNSYSLENISMERLNNTVMEDIINEDIDTLVSSTIDRQLTETTVENGEKYLGANQETYTIPNSIDYCPAPKKLPSYISNIEKYTQFYNQNILSKEEYSNISEEGVFVEIFKKLFSCDSSTKLGYDNCNLSKNVNSKLLNKDTLPISTTNIVWGSKINLMSRVYLKQITAIYDNIYVNHGQDTKDIRDFSNLVIDINAEKEISETTFCSMYKVYDAFSRVDKSYSADKDFIKGVVLANLEKVTSAQCLGIFTETELDLQGSYLKVYFSNISNKGIFRIYNDCNNLSSLFN